MVFVFNKSLEEGEILLPQTRALLQIARVSKLNLVSGAIFDALIAQAALKANADQLLTFNAKHFSRLGEDIASIVVTPT